MTRQAAAVFAALLVTAVAIGSAAIAREAPPGHEQMAHTTAYTPDASWLSCHRDAQCVQLPGPCGASIAVNLDHRKLMEQHVAQVASRSECASPPLPGQPSRAACVARACKVLPTAP